MVPAFNFLFFMFFSLIVCRGFPMRNWVSSAFLYGPSGRRQAVRALGSVVLLWCCRVHCESWCCSGMRDSVRFILCFCGLFGCLHGGVDKHLTWTSTVAGLHSLPASIRGVFLKVDSKELFLAAFHQSSSHYIFVSLLVSGRSR